MSYTNSSKKNKVALIDCNSFYVSCERLFNPKINNKPAVVLSNNDGCVISRSTEAKRLGIKMGEPYFKVKELVRKNNVNIFSSNYALYGDISRRVMKVLKEFSPEQANRMQLLEERIKLVSKRIEIVEGNEKNQYKALIRIPLN